MLLHNSIHVGNQPFSGDTMNIILTEVKLIIVSLNYANLVKQRLGISEQRYKLEKITKKGEAVDENREQEKVNIFFFKRDTECL